MSAGLQCSIDDAEVIDNAFDVLAIQNIAVVQAIDFLKCHSRLSPFFIRCTKMSGYCRSDRGR